MILNCDLVIASQDAKFALPEVKRGVVAIQGGKYLLVFQLNYVAFFSLTMKFHFSFFFYFYLTGNINFFFYRYSSTLQDSRTPGKYPFIMV